MMKFITPSNLFIVNNMAERVGFKSRIFAYVTCLQALS